jgi:hypothetical protein
MLATSRTIHTNTTTSTTTTRGRPASLTCAYNDSKQHFDSINVSSIIGYWKSLIPGQHFTYAKNSFSAYYAFCHAVNKLCYLKACEEYYTVGHLFYIDTGELLYSEVKKYPWGLL